MFDYQTFYMSALLSKCRGLCQYSFYHVEQLSYVVLGENDWSLARIVGSDVFLGSPVNY